MAHHEARDKRGLERAFETSRRLKILSVIGGILLAGGGAYGDELGRRLGAGSSGESRSASISNLTILAVASPTPSNLLYPGGHGRRGRDRSANPNPYPVTITADAAPDEHAAYAAGHTTSASDDDADRGASPPRRATVTRNFSTGTSGSSHTLTTRADGRRRAGQSNNPLAVTLTERQDR